MTINYQVTLKTLQVTSLSKGRALRNGVILKHKIYKGILQVKTRTTRLISESKCQKTHGLVKKM